LELAAALTRQTMIRHYLKVALRQFYKLPVFSAINIVGLVIGLASSLLIGMWVHDELTWDDYHTNRKNIYRVYAQRDDDDGITTSMAVPLALWDEFKTNHPDIEYVSPANWGWNVQLSYKDTKIEKFNYFVAPDFLHMFTVPVIKGSQNGLDEPTSIMLTQSTAKELFGDEDPIGKSVKMGTGSGGLLTVTAIIQDPPTNSSLQYKCLMPFAYYMQSDPFVKRNLTNWTNSSFNMYVSLRNGLDPKVVEEHIKDVIKIHTPDEITRAEVTILPMTRWHLYNQWDNGESVAGQMTYVKIFAVIGIFILFIACINFTNLSTARSERRAKEVGIRKSIGSNRSQLIAQFLGETLLMAIFAFVLAFIIVQSVLPAFNSLVGKKLEFDFGSPLFWVTSTLVIVLTSITAGAYPAFYLSGFRPAHVLKGRTKTTGGFLPRRVLVTVQFFFSITLMIATTVVYQQISYLKDRDTGYDQNNLVRIWIGHFAGKYESFKNEALQKGYATSITRANSPITNIYSMTADIYWPGKREDQRSYLAIIETDYDYTKTTGMKVLQGRDFSPEHADSTSVILNETAVKYMNLEDPVGTTIKVEEDPYTVVGVVQDVVMAGPDDTIAPAVYIFNHNKLAAETIIRLPNGREQEAIAGFGEMFKQYAPDAIFNFAFTDQEYARKFVQIERTGEFTNIFASMAIFVSCLGLFGLAAFTAERRTKEIGIRKVLGASIASIVSLISKEFAVLVVIAFALAAPLALWQVNSFLSQYEYHVNVSWWVFPITGFGALLLAVITVGTQAFRAAKSNPVDSLKTE
jgi:putative ABC transport system permease protein